MLSGINDAIETIAYGTGEDADINAIYAILLSPIIGYFGQAIPTLVSQVAQALEDEPTTSYVKDIEGGFQQNVARSILNTVNRIPRRDTQQPLWTRLDEGKKMVMLHGIYLSHSSPPVMRLKLQQPM